MNKKIYFKDNYLEFVTEELQAAQNQSIKKNIPFLDSDLEIKKKVKDLLNEAFVTQFVHVNSFSDELEKLKKEFIYIEAAGGLIEKEGSYLFIHRMSKWDLPKGKLDVGEKTEDCAMRECEEECGIKDLYIVKNLPSTFHLYPYKNYFALKQTFWFYMQTNYSGNLTPQLEEDINEARWMNLNEIETTVKSNTYKALSDIINSIPGLANN